jgi:hypothetical protein
MAFGGLHINLGERSRHAASEPLYNRCSHVPGEFELNIGEQALGGTYINFGMCGDMGKSASGGTFIQLGQIAQGSYDIGNNARNAVCVGARHPEYDSHYANHNVSEFELKYGKDETLRGLLGELKSGWPFSADDDVDAPKIKDIARKVDAHVRGKYGRRVA